MTIIDIIRLPVEYKTAPIRNMLFNQYNHAFGELQLPGLVTHPVIAPIAKDIQTKLKNHFGEYYEMDLKSDARNSVVM